MSLTPDGVRTTSPQTTTRFIGGRALEEVTVHDDVIVLWVEPAAGALIPR